MSHIDEETLKALKRGQVVDFEKIYRLYVGRVYNFIFSMIKDSVVSKDLTQDVFVQIWNKRADIDYTGNFEGYLFTITKNMVYYHIRRELLLQNYISKMKHDTDGRLSDIEKKLDDEFFAENISKFVEELPEARKKIFLLYWKSDMSYKEIAEQLSISEKTVATQVNRSLRFLREKIDGKMLSVILLFLSGNL